MAGLVKAAAGGGPPEIGRIDRRPRTRHAVLAACAAAVGLAGAAATAGGDAGSAISVRVERIEEFSIARPGERFGALTFRGGLVLSAPRGFGGLSGLVLTPAGDRLVAVSDLGSWFTAQLETDADGRLTGLRETRWFARLGENGTPPATKSEADAEALALQRSDTRPLLVAVETQPFLLAYPMPPTADAVPERIALPAAVGTVIARHGIEALAVAPAGAGTTAGALFVATENASAGTPDAWLVQNGRAIAVTLQRDPEWAITGADFLPDGDLVLLERRFRRPIWIGMRIRRISHQALTARGPIRGSVLIEADLSHEIDNMEGIAAHRDARGRTFLTLLSDDNRNLVQRNLVLRFQLDVPPPRRRPPPANAAMPADPMPPGKPDQPDRPAGG